MVAAFKQHVPLLWAWGWGEATEPTSHLGRPPLLPLETLEGGGEGPLYKLADLPVTQVKMSSASGCSCQEQTGRSLSVSGHVSLEDSGNCV